MLFNSSAFLFIFLPLALAGFYGLRRFRFWHAAEAWLLLASLSFYAVWDVRYLPILLSSILVNYAIGQRLLRVPSKGLLAIGVAFNLALLGYFKYADFFIQNINVATGSSVDLLSIALPIGISFFTFQQIAYLVDSHKGNAQYDVGFITYGNFVSFFPQLIAGPIVHHREIAPQLSALTAGRSVLASQIATGLFIFSIGLFKKVVIADNLAPWANPVFADAQNAGFFDAWVGALSYTLQLYFDFSGYCDMAIGLGLLFGITLPVNFASPYKAHSITEFWRRWHITLGSFLRSYLYIPLGGSRSGTTRVVIALLVTMLLGGLWHGAAWTFVLWGLMHGAYLVLHRLWMRLDMPLPKPMAWTLTFCAVLFAWVLFRAQTPGDALALWSAMLGFDGLSLPSSLHEMLGWLGTLVTWAPPRHAAGYELFVLMPLLYFVVSQPNVSQLSRNFTPTSRLGWVAIALAVVAVANLGEASEFIYFRF